MAKELILTRTFTASRELAWKAWTEEKLVATWWGPNGVTNPICRVDAQPGGEIYIVMLAGDELGSMKGSRWPMKWPLSITFVRHGQSDYNALRERKAKDRVCQQFKAAYQANFRSPLARELAREIRCKYALKVSDYETPLTEEGKIQAERTGKQLSTRPDLVHVPRVIFYSPYLRTKQTVEHLKSAWGGLCKATEVPDDRIREQEHGLSLLYSDWRVFHVMHPEQKELYELLGPYWYQYPNGESVSHVRDRGRDFSGMLIREWAGEHVMVVTHHLTILSFRANYERLTPEKFIRLDEDEKPVNCGVTIYHCDPSRGRDGRLFLQTYNQKFY